MQNANKTRGAGPLGGAGMIGLWGASGLIEAIQYGTIALSGAQATNTATITSVDLSRSILIDLRQSNNWSGGTQPSYTSNTLALTNSTTVTASRQAAGGLTLTAAFCVVTFNPGVVRSVQSGVVASAGSPTVSITSVNTAKTLLLSLGLEGDSGGRDDYFYGYWQLTNSTTLTLQRGASGGTSMKAGWLALEFF